MRDQNVIFITENLTLEVEAWADRIPEPYCPILASTNHLGKTYFHMLGTSHVGGKDFCQEDRSKLPTGHLALNKEERKARALYTFPSNLSSDEPLLLLEVEIRMGKREVRKVL